MYLVCNIFILRAKDIYKRDHILRIVLLIFATMIFLTLTNKIHAYE